MSALERARGALVDQAVATEFVAAIGEPPDAILELAARRQADLIVVGTREPNFVQRILGQSVSSSVSRHSPCDVLIVH